MNKAKNDFMQNDFTFFGKQENVRF